MSEDFEPLIRMYCKDISWKYSESTVAGIRNTLRVLNRYAQRSEWWPEHPSEIEVQHIARYVQDRGSKHRLSPRTTERYARDILAFADWCRSVGDVPVAAAHQEPAWRDPTIGYYYVAEATHDGIVVDVMSESGTRGEAEKEMALKLKNALNRDPCFYVVHILSGCGRLWRRGYD